MTVDDKLLAIRDAIQVDVGNRGLARDPRDNLFTACAGDFAAACRSIANSEGGLAILTGFYIRDADPPASESDGPLGAVFLANALMRLKRPVVIFTDVFCKPALDAGLKKVGIFWEYKVGSERFTKAGLPRTSVQTVPPGRHPWFAYVAVDWHHAIEGFGFDHVLAIERVGPSRMDGRCYSMRMKDVTDLTPPMHHLVDECRRISPPVCTIGIGDGGNEIGMGKIAWSTIARNTPHGNEIACRVPTDHLIVAGVSNWGAYALAAGIYLLRGVKPPAELFDPDRERAILEVMVREGPLVDGVTGKQEATVDGLTWDEYIKPLVEIGRILGV